MNRSAVAGLARLRGFNGELSKRSALRSAFHSFDVFDTVVTRIVGEPRSVFLLVGEAAVSQDMWCGSAEQFARARIEAESRARNVIAPKEVTFTRIYRELGRSYDLSPEILERLAELELTVERGLIRVVPAIARELERARAAGHVVGFISDMYLPHDVLRTWLVELGALRGEERLWVSSEHGVTKSAGSLFELVRADTASAFESWIHKGDNGHSDVGVPEALGIRAEHYLECHLNLNEQSMQTAATETRGLASLFAGASRWTRLNRPSDTETALNDLAADIAAPVLYAFVLWTLLEAKKRGLKRIWFMARDGQVMLPTARVIADRLGLDLELGYLYAGRQVVRVASLTSIDEAALEWITGGAGVISLQAVLDRVGLQLAQVHQHALSNQLPLSGPIGWARIKLLKSFLQHPEVAALILVEAAARRTIVLDYFRTCGLMDDESCAVVDIGWRGNVMRSVVDLLGVVQAAKHTFLYFGLYAHPKGCEGIPKRAYLFDIDGEDRVGTGYDIPSLTTLMEIFCQADHGQVMMLERKGLGFQPLCRAQEPSQSGLGWDIAKFQAVVLKFAQTVPIDSAPFAEADLRGASDQLLRRLATSPSATEVALLAPLGFVDDQGGSKPQPFAHSYEWSHIRAAYRTGDSRPSLSLNWWSAGAAMLTPNVLRLAMRAAAKVGRRRISSAAAV